MATYSGGGGNSSSSGSNDRARQQAILLERTREMASLDVVRSNVTITSSLSTIHSSALQADLAKKYNLPGASRITHSIVKSSKQKPLTSRSAVSDGTSSSARQPSSSSVPTSSSATTQRSRRAEPALVLCLSCEYENEADAAVCACCGYFLNSARQQNLSLAQKLGITEGPKSVNIISLADWEAIEKKAGARNEAFCPICMVGFNQGSEVLLSCSHVFHQACIYSFERFSQSKERTCPICRCTDYQKRLTHKGSKAFQVICAVKIQSLYRGFRCRRQYRSSLRSFYRNNGAIQNPQRRKFYEQELSSCATEIQKHFDKRTSEVDSFMRYKDLRFCYCVSATSLFFSLFRVIWLLFMMFPIVNNWNCLSQHSYGPIALLCMCAAPWTTH